MVMQKRANYSFGKELKVEFNNSKKIELINTMIIELPVLRARIGASQADISERIGVSRQTYNAIENGKKKMSSATSSSISISYSAAQTAGQSKARSLTEPLIS